MILVSKSTLASLFFGTTMKLVYFAPPTPHSREVVSADMTVAKQSHPSHPASAKTKGRMKTSRIPQSELSAGNGSSRLFKMRVRSLGCNVRVG